MDNVNEYFHYCQNAKSESIAFISNYTYYPFVLARKKGKWVVDTENRATRSIRGSGAVALLYKK